MSSVQLGLHAILLTSAFRNNALLTSSPSLYLCSLLCSASFGSFSESSPVTLILCDIQLMMHHTCPFIEMRTKIECAAVWRPALLLPFSSSPLLFCSTAETTPSAAA